LDTAPLNFANDWQNVRGVTVCLLLPGQNRMSPGFRELRVPETFATRLSRLQGRRCPRTDDLALVLGNCRQDMDRQLICVRVVHSDKLHGGVHEGSDKCEVSGQSIELGNNQPGFQLLASRERLL
jgi:hypothetical protein